MNTHAEIEYIKSEYIRQSFINESETISINQTEFDYNIYPWIKGYIPKCSICTEMYDKYKEDNNKPNELKALHKSCGCLWFNWYKTKLLKINPDIKFK